jgi:hypothetical protein
MDSMWDNGSPQSVPSGTVALEPSQLDFPELDQMLSSDPYSTAHLDNSCVDPFEISGQSHQTDHMGLWDLAFDNINQPFQDTEQLERTSPELSPVVIFDHCEKTRDWISSAASTLIGPQALPVPGGVAKDSYQLEHTSQQDYSITCLEPSISQAPQFQLAEMSHKNLWSELDEMTAEELEHSIMNIEPFVSGQHKEISSHILTEAKELAPEDFILMAEPNYADLIKSPSLRLLSPRTDETLDAHSVNKDICLLSQNSSANEDAQKLANRGSGHSLSHESKPKMITWEYPTSSKVKPSTVGPAGGIPKKKKPLGRRGRLSPEGAKKATAMRRRRACLSCWILKVEVSFMF